MNHPFFLFLLIACYEVDYEEESAQGSDSTTTETVSPEESTPNPTTTPQPNASDTAGGSMADKWTESWLSASKSRGKFLKNDFTILHDNLTDFNVALKVTRVTL
jgi:hypothetical protein